MFICDICDEGEHCVDCPKNYPDEQCEHWVEVDYVKHGHWIVRCTPIGSEYTICSNCNTDFKFRTDRGTLARLDMRGITYCPNCGARMDEVSE